MPVAKQRNEMEYHNFDYLKPIGNAEDMRTAQYRGHRHQRDPVAVTRYSTMSQPTHVYSRRLQPEDFFQTQNQATYNWKSSDPAVKRNPHLELTNVMAMKRLNEKHYLSAPKPIKEFETTTNCDFGPKEAPTFDRPVMERPTEYEVKRSTDWLDPSKPGHTKYFDFMATTNRLTYHVHEDKRLAENDMITAWNWLGLHSKNIRAHMIETEKPMSLAAIKEKLCIKGPKSAGPARRAEFASQVKHVPYSGLTTETRQNYRIPDPHDKFKVDLITPVRLQPDENLVPYMGMNELYGSGAPVDRFVSIKNYNKMVK